MGIEHHGVNPKMKSIFRYHVTVDDVTMLHFQSQQDLVQEIFNRLREDKKH